MFPDKIDTFVDLFCGGCNVGINVNANKIICNDIEEHIINLMLVFKEYSKEKIFNSILHIIKEYKLSDSTIKSYNDYNCNSSDGLGRYNKDAYLELRQCYNNKPNKNTYEANIMFYILTCYSFSNQIRFNSKEEFNMPYGKRYFNKSMRDKLNRFLDKIHNIDMKFINNDFLQLKINKLNKTDFVYCDPPYLISCASYNEQNGWNKDKEERLLDLLDRIHKSNIKFALSNVLENKGKSNDILKNWSKKYNIHHLNNTYSNCNYHRKDKIKNSDEVLITNY